MEKLTNIGTIKSLMAKYGFEFSKGLGQNFLINPSVCPRMADMAQDNDIKGVIEIGPGFGVLTHELSQNFEKVIAIEIDERLRPVLSETLADCKNTSVIFSDVLKLDLKKLIADEFGGEKVAICANLPYYITSPIIMKLLEDRLPITSITAMVQKEAAVRLCATPGTRDCGAISSAIRLYGTPEILFDVSKGSFMPPPNVVSAVIKINVENDKYAVYTKKFTRLNRALFAMRRKTAVNCLFDEYKVPKADIAVIFEEIGIDVKARAENITIDQIVALAEKF